MPERQVITALTGTSAPLLTVDVSIVEEMDFSSIWLPRSWKKCVPYVTDVHEIDFVGGPSLLSLDGTHRSFEIAKVATLIDDVVLQVELPPHQIVPLGAAVSYVDWLGFSMWEWMEMRYSSNNTFRIHPIDEYLRVRKTLGLERLDSMQRRVYGDQSTAQLTNLFQNGTGQEKLYIPLYYPFGDDPMEALPIVDLSQRVTFHIQLKPLRNIIHNLQTATVTPLGDYRIRMIANLVNVTGHETSYFIALSEEPTGITYMIHQYQLDVKENITSTGPNNHIHHHLHAISRPLMYINWALQPTALMNNSGNNDNFFFEPNPPAPIPPGMTPYGRVNWWYIRSNNQTIQRLVERRYTTFYNYDRFNKGFSGEAQFDQMYAQYPHAINAATGYLDYANLSNPELVIELESPGSGVDPNDPRMQQRLTLTVVGKDYNFWFIKGGNLTRAFN